MIHLTESPLPLQKTNHTRTEAKEIIKENKKKSPHAASSRSGYTAPKPKIRTPKKGEEARPKQRKTAF